MTKSEFIGVVAEKTGSTKKVVDEVVDAVFETIKEALAKDDSVSFLGFGSFSTAERAAREARVPATGATIKVPARKVVKFKVGKALKDAVSAVVEPVVEKAPVAEPAPAKKSTKKSK